MIKLTELIQMSGVALDDYKIHCATSHTNTPLEAFFDAKLELLFRMHRIFTSYAHSSVTMISTSSFKSSRDVCTAVMGLLGFAYVTTATFITERGNGLALLHNKLAQRRGGSI